MRMADSRGLLGANPLEVIWAALEALPQSSLVAIVAWSDMRTSDIVGLASAPLTPKFASEGPMARTTTVCATRPWITKPPIITLRPVCTWPRGEMLARRGGLAAVMVNDSAEDEEAAYEESRWYAAVMLWLPKASEEVTSRACAEPFSATVPMAVPPSLKITEPVGVGDVPDTVAVNVTAAPTVADDVGAATRAVVDADPHDVRIGGVDGDGGLRPEIHRGGNGSHLRPRRRG